MMASIITTRRRQLAALLLWWTGVAACAQPQYLVTQYDEDNGVPSAHVTQLLQDDSGFMWFSTWNGLCRFDGYEFQTFKPQAADGCHAVSDRIRSIWLTDRGDICCKGDDSYVLFRLDSYTFSDITDSVELSAAKASEHHTARRGHRVGGHFEMTDRQGLLWQLRDGAIRRLQPIRHPATPVPQQQPAQTRCLARDSDGRIWVTTREDATVRLFDSRLNPLGYLRPDGRLQAGYVSFGHPVYCVTESRDGVFWLGTKPGGLFRYDSRRQQLRHVDGLPHDAVYDVKEDSRGRLWVATLGGGIVCIDGDSIHQFLAPLKVRYIHLTADDVLLATTTEGLIAGRLDKHAVSRTRFKRHRREASRANSLNCNATMDIVEDSRGRLLVSTESGGVSELAGSDLTADSLSFRRMPMHGGWPTDVALAMADMADGGQMLIVCSNQLIAYDPVQERGTTYDARFFNHPYRFTEVRPLLLDDGRWLIGSTEGAFTLSPQDIRREPYVPDIVLTSVTIRNGSTRYAVNRLDTLTLAPAERSVTIRFAALDFTDASRTRYEFRLGGADEPWSNIGHDHSVTLFDLGPGSYELWLRSTNAEGIGVNNVRRLVVTVLPTFWESAWGRIVAALLMAAAAGLTVYTLLYIRRIKRKQRETLQAYLSLLEGNSDATAQPVSPAPQADKREDPVLRRVMAFIEENLSDSEATVGDMAAAAATSRSGLQRKLKQSMGVTPQELLREARIKHACQLLRTTDKSIADVAYSCGFTDPKYFSRCFKQSTGRTPSEYKTAPV